MKSLPDENKDFIQKILLINPSDLSQRVKDPRPQLQRNRMVTAYDFNPRVSVCFLQLNQYPIKNLNQSVAVGL